MNRKQRRIEAKNGLGGTSRKQPVLESVICAVPNRLSDIYRWTYLTDLDAGAHALAA